MTLASGAVATLQEQMVEEADEGVVHRFRFVSEGFDPVANTPESIQSDLELLCTDYAIPALAGAGMEAEHVIISLADRAVEFGVRDPSVWQVFEAFSIEDGACIWEMY